jgi:beta-apo-4'-carotenal oxygenase
MLIENSHIVLSNVTSGGATLNDAYFHASFPQVPFGGVGDSGYGAYHGKASFDCFSHKRSIVQTPGWMDKLLRVRYMPYSLAEYKKLERMNPKPDFDRSGKQVRGVGYVAGLVFGLGGKTVKGALVRWILVLASWYALTFKR